MKTYKLIATIEGAEVTLKIPAELVTADEIAERKIKIARQYAKTGDTVTFQILD